MKIKFITLSLIFIFLDCGSPTNKNELEKSGKSTHLEKAWFISSTAECVKNEGLLNVESIIYDEARQVFYATNGVDYELGTNGFISKYHRMGAFKN